MKALKQNLRIVGRFIRGTCLYLFNRDKFLAETYAKDYFYYMRSCKCSVKKNGAIPVSPNCMKTDLQRNGRFCVKRNPHYKSESFLAFCKMVDQSKLTREKFLKTINEELKK